MSAPAPAVQGRRERGSGVKGRLTPHGARPVVENDDFAAFARRVVAAHGRRVATGDVDGLVDLAALDAALQSATRSAVTGLRACGYPWAEIGDRLGISRQAAQQRWGGDTHEP